MIEADVFTVAIVVGAIEQDDPTARFGSLLGYEHHRRVAIQHGLLTDQDEATQKARVLYSRHSLMALPLGRAASWPPERVAVLLDELNQVRP